MSTLKNIKGIGPKSELLLNKLGIMNISDLLTYYPSRYDILKRSNLDNLMEDEKLIIDGKVDSTPVVLRFNKSLNKMNFRLLTSKGVFGVSIFNRAFMKSNLSIGTSVIIIGKYEQKKNIINASDIKFGSLSGEVKILPVYHLTNGLTNKVLSNYINMGITMYGKELIDYIPNYLKEKYPPFNINKKIALNIIHNPPNEEKLDIMLKRFKYEELFVFMAKINYLREKNKKDNGLERFIKENDIDNFYQLLPFELTTDQKKVIKEIVNDMNAKRAMNRLLQGDVGSGKTIVSFAAIYFNTLSGYQSALMAPTEILATQHYENMQKIFKNKLRVRLLIGSLTKKEKLEIYDELAEGKIDVIIGTHAIIQDNVKFNNLGLVITDEQHRFGVNQRANLKNKGMTPDVLYMSATPIPRTFALTIYGDMDVSIIKEMPKGREAVKTKVVRSDETTKIYNEMKKVLNTEIKGKKNLYNQVYVVAPLIEDVMESNLTSVEELCQNIDNELNANENERKYKIGVLHGKMTNQLKDEIMVKFKNHEIDVLVSTTVIEVGVDVPDASLMVIFDANRFGLSTLHQLRGRVGRGDIKSYCLLVSKEETERLKILEKTNDGFLIAEEDFKLRGSGDLFGTRQSGDMTFKIANLREDYHILEYANKDAKEFWQKSDVDLIPLKEKIISLIDTN